MRYLVTFSRDWADEFQMEGFKICTKEKADELRQWASTERTDYFGTNEGWEDEILLDSLTFQEITDDEAAVIEKFFPRCRLGHVPNVYYDD